MKRLKKHIRPLVPWVAGVLLIVLAAAIFCLRHRLLFVEAFESYELMRHPSADLAYAYGVRHFDAIDAQDYDIDRAEELFRLSLRLDPKHPYAYHEIARIEFLRGDFPEALLDINQEFAVNPHPMPASYYVRALIHGYMGDYLSAAKDYETYFKVTSANWAAINDYSWVLLKANDPADAHAALAWGLKEWPGNPWLLANDAIALYELGRKNEAETTIKEAQAAVGTISELGWRVAYPGNDPAIAEAGLANFRAAVDKNAQEIESATGTKPSLIDSPLSR